MTRRQEIRDEDGSLMVIVVLALALGAVLGLAGRAHAETAGVGTSSAQAAQHSQAVQALQTIPPDPSTTAAGRPSLGMTKNAEAGVPLGGIGMTNQTTQGPSTAAAGRPPLGMTKTKVGVVRRVVVSIPDRKLALVEDGETKKVYPVAVGADGSPSPAGSFRVVNRLTRPTYYHPGTVIGPGAQNPLGTRWVGLDRRGYGIHGTNQPKSIGKAASHGCIRMARRDLEELFELVRVGDAVEIHGERDDAVAAVFGIAPDGATAALGGDAGDSGNR